MGTKQLPKFERGCDEVARLVQSEVKPLWQSEYFSHWAMRIGQEWSIRELQPTRAKTKERISEIDRLSDELIDKLNDVVTSSYLRQATGPGLENEIAQLKEALAPIRQRLLLGFLSPLVSTPSGKTKVGRGKTPSPDTIDPKVLCALVVAEAWRYSRNKYPSPKDLGAAEAAVSYWKTVGYWTKEPRSWGDPRGAWRPYFQRARRSEFAELRQHCARILGFLGSRLPADRA